MDFPACHVSLQELMGKYKDYLLKAPWPAPVSWHFPEKFSAAALWLGRLSNGRGRETKGCKVYNSQKKLNFCLQFHDVSRFFWGYQVSMGGCVQSASGIWIKATQRRGCFTIHNWLILWMVIDHMDLEHTSLLHNPIIPEVQSSPPGSRSSQSPRFLYIYIIILGFDSHFVYFRKSSNK